MLNKTEKLLEIDYQLNRWKYPEMFWFCEPEYFENMQGYYRIGNISDERLKFLRKAMCKYDFIFPAINILRSRTTEKERFYYRRNLKS